MNLTPELTLEQWFARIVVEEPRTGDAATVSPHRDRRYCKRCRTQIQDTQAYCSRHRGKQ
jgi:hypothetical protein